MEQKTSSRLLGLIVIVILIVAVVLGLRGSHGNPLSAPVASVSYMCSGGKTIAADFYDGPTTPGATADQPPTPGGSAALALSDGRSMTLPQTISADGARYANADESFVFWSRGNGALVLENNKEQSYTGCIATAKDPGGLPQGYANGAAGFSIRLPSLQASTTDNGATYKLDEAYQYLDMGPGKEISGIKFGIPPDLASGTNLSLDSYISVEEIPQVQECSAALFESLGARAQTVSDGDTTYSVASTSGAAAGNRYEETIYALPGTNPCIAVRYFIHYGAFENYPAGTVQEFDKQALLAQFDAIRRTLTVNQ